MASATTSRALLVALLMLLSKAVVAGDDATTAFLKAQFLVPPAAATLQVRGAVAATCREVLGYGYPQPRIVYYPGDEGTAWILSARGKHGPMTAGVLVANGCIEVVRVLADREARGRPVRSRRFLKQYDGLALDKAGELDKRVDAITGATVSSTAVTSMARLALRLIVFTSG